jgi:hypothetical protein
MAILSTSVIVLDWIDVESIDLSLRWEPNPDPGMGVFRTLLPSTGSLTSELSFISWQGTPNGSPGCHTCWFIT